jgi:hypothetical protein
LVVPLGWLRQVLPPFVVRRIVPLTHLFTEDARLY